MDYLNYQNPLIQRYSSKEMSYNFSAEFKFITWRKLWIVLAEEEHKLGLNISLEQLKELKNFEKKINYEEALEFEKTLHHEVMSHIYAYGKQCPKAKKIIHLGATSAYILDNTDLIQIKSAIKIIKKQLINLIVKLKSFCLKYKNLTSLGFTHYQPAQPTTVGKRASLWLQDLIYDYHDLEFRLSNIRFRGIKGTTGSQNSFLKLFNGDKNKVFSLDKAISKRMGFENSISVTGQTYSRKIDYSILSMLSSIAQSSHKFSNDIRLLQNMNEIEEPFSKNQIGSSAMPYKRNPMKSERIASLARYVINLTQNAAMTSSNQWFERTLDDSANKRITIPEAFLAINAILRLYTNIIEGLTVNKKIIARHLQDKIPFMISEDILMIAVKRGADRQEIHEIIRKSSFEALEHIQKFGEKNPLISLLAKNHKICLSEKEMKELLKHSKLNGLCAEQVLLFIKYDVDPILTKEKKLIEKLINKEKIEF